MRVIPDIPLSAEPYVSILKRARQSDNDHKLLLERLVPLISQHNIPMSQVLYAQLARLYYDAQQFDLVGRVC
jgi:hypothetical protein